jgi:hypothetical protein
MINWKSGDASLFDRHDPIEMVFSKFKTLLRQAPERTVEGLWRRIGALLDQFTPAECGNYFRAAGYGDSF